MIFDRLIR